MLFTKPYLLHVLNMLVETSVCEFLGIRTDAKFMPEIFSRETPTRELPRKEIRSCFIRTSQLLNLYNYYHVLTETIFTKAK